MRRASAAIRSRGACIGCARACKPSAHRSLSPSRKPAPLATPAESVANVRCLSRTRPRRSVTRRAHRKLVAATQIVLARCCGEEADARSIGARRIQLALSSRPRFSTRDRLGLHQYQTNLRLRHALERLAEDVTADLTMLALELGFSSHAHFTAAFRRAFQVAPSRSRKKQSPALTNPLAWKAQRMVSIRHQAEQAIAGAKASRLFPIRARPISRRSCLITSMQSRWRDFLRDDPALRLDYCSNVTGVDWLDRTVKKKVKVKKLVEGEEKEVEETQEEFFPVISRRFITFTRWRKTRAGRRSAADRRSRGRRALPVAHPGLAERGIPGARDLRSLRHPFRRPSRSAPHPDVGRIHRFPDAQGLSRAGRLRIRADAARRRAGKGEAALRRAPGAGRRGKYRAANMSHLERPAQRSSKLRTARTPMPAMTSRLRRRAARSLDGPAASIDPRRFPDERRARRRDRAQAQAGLRLPASQPREDRREHAATSARCLTPIGSITFAR